MVLLPALPTNARVHHGEAWARASFTKAEQMREALNGRPAQDRSQHDYQHVIDAYRRVYFGSPISSKADASVVAVAELQVEMGRRFDDNRALQASVQQYEFLRKEYPGSKYRFDALFTIGEIYKDDLGDPEEALATFQEFLRRYPRSRLADDARQAIAELKQEAASPQKAAAQREAEKYQVAADLPGAPIKASPPAAAKSDVAPDKLGSEKESDRPSDSSQKLASFPRVTGIRHWSAPDYTRVAIDVEEDIEFDSQRLDHPDRIYFDLHNTKLASTLVGKSFGVDDGFLKKIRVAQFKPGKTRVVLEVDDLSDYDAFLLSNPSRLIIDIHGRGPKGAGPAVAESNTRGQRTSKVDNSATGPDTAAQPDRSRKPVADPVTEARLQPGKPTVETITVGTHPVKKIIEAGDQDRDTPDKPAKRSVADLPPDLPPSAASADDSGDDAPAEAPIPTKKSAGTRGKSKHSMTAGTATSDIDAREARPTQEGDRSLTRALGLKIGKIVIDPGHGGHDTGTIGPEGLQEKDLVLDVGRRLGKLLETRMGAEVVYTRKDDTFIPLETRTAIANHERADLFVSIHANSSHDPNARGVETYYLNFTSSPDALEVAARENAVSEKSVHELGDLVKKIALKEKIEESHEFASDVQQALHSGLSSKDPGVRDRGVKKAPFIVLIGANMPSILAEISFISNPTDERKLDTSECRQRIAESLYRGIAKYVGGLSGVKLASRVPTNEEQ